MKNYYIYKYKKIVVLLKNFFSIIIFFEEENMINIAIVEDNDNDYNDLDNF